MAISGGLKSMGSLDGGGEADERGRREVVVNGDGAVDGDGDGDGEGAVAVAVAITIMIGLAEGGRWWKCLFGFLFCGWGGFDVVFGWGLTERGFYLLEVVRPRLRYDLSTGAGDTSAFVN